MSITYYTSIIGHSSTDLVTMPFANIKTYSKVTPIASLASDGSTKPSQPSVTYKERVPDINEPTTSNLTNDSAEFVFWDRNKFKEPLQCNYCNKSFTRWGGLKLHGLGAHGIKYDRGDLFVGKQKKYIPDPSRPHKCDVCKTPVYYSTKTSLIDHLFKIHDIDKREYNMPRKRGESGTLECVQCDKKITRGNNKYIKHLKDEHDITIDRETLTFTNVEGKIVVR